MIGFRLFALFGVMAQAVAVGLCVPAICLADSAGGATWRRTACLAVLATLALGACIWFGAAAAWVAQSTWREAALSYEHLTGLLLPALRTCLQGAVLLGSWLVLAAPGLVTVAWTEHARRISRPSRKAVAARLMADAGGLLLALAAALFVAAVCSMHAHPS